jgi:hypothetical protein
MSAKSFHDELERALARTDADQMCRQLDAYAEYNRNGRGEWTKEASDAFGEIISCYHDDPEKAFAYVILGASRSDNAEFLAGLGCGPLEDVLEDPSEELLQRIVAEARKSPRFRWLLSNPFKVAIAARAWDAIDRFRITGSREEPAFDKLPPCH